jgi:hypothetical protein
MPQYINLPHVHCQRVCPLMNIWCFHHLFDCSGHGQIVLHPSNNEIILHNFRDLSALRDANFFLLAPLPLKTIAQFFMIILILLVYLCSSFLVLGLLRAQMAHPPGLAGRAFCAKLDTCEMLSSPASLGKCAK